MSTAYGSITVSGLTDIADIYFEYALAVSNANVTNSYPFNQVGELGWTINDESRKIPPTWQAGYKVWVREVKVKTDITTKFYGEPYPDTAVNQTSQDLIALQTKVKKIWSNSTGSYMASGIGLNDVNIENVSTYGFNSRSTTSGISLNYNNAKIVDLNSTPSLDFYQPPTINGTVVTPGNKTMSLSGQALKFYSPSDGATELATLNANGLLLKAGGLESGSFANNQNYIYVSTNNTASRTIGTGTNKTNWRIIAGNKFGVDSLGNLYATSANITGAITATSLDLTTHNVKINYGSINNTPDLTVYIAKDGTIGTEPSDSAASSSTGFKVSSAGLLKAANAVITGKIFASSGTIGGWNIGTDTNKSLFYGNQQPGATTNNLVISSSSAENTIPIAGSDINKHWFLSAGTKFGVDTEGNLYANNANLSNATVEGAITATSLTIGSGGSSYNAWDAINITGYSLDIEVDATGVSDIYNTTYLYPHLYHNGTEITLSSSATTAQKQEFYNKFLWYEGDSSTAVQGDYLNKGRILASYNDYWKVTYSFNDGATEGAEPIQQVIVDPSTYITRVNDNTIKVHSKNWNESTGFVQINNQGNIIATGQVYQENNMPLTTVQLVKW